MAKKNPQPPKELHKVTFGFITERWTNTPKKEFLGQEFSSDYDTEYEDELGNELPEELFEGLKNPE